MVNPCYEVSREYCPMQVTNKLKSAWLRAGEHNMLGRVKEGGLVWSEEDLIAFFNYLLTEYGEVSTKHFSEVIVIG